MIDHSEKRKVPFNNLSIENPKVYLQKFASILQKGKFILGEEVSLFEKNFAKYVGTKYCVGVGSGTDAILLALRALNISKDDEVIVPAFTFIASATPILMLGARPVFVDIKKDLPLIDEDKIEDAITPKTRAIIAVHLYGYPCNLKKIKAIAKKYKIALIEDCAQAHGTTYNKKQIGSFGDMAVFSFYPTKNLGAFGDAGALVTSNKKLYNTIHLLRDHGQEKRYSHKLLGYNSRLDTLQAAVLSIKLQTLDQEIDKRSNMFAFYTKNIAQLPVDIFAYPDATVKIAPHLYVIRVKQRKELIEFLNKRGIDTVIHYPVALPDEGIFKGVLAKRDYPNARVFAASVLSLPFFIGMTQKQMRYVVDSLSEFFISKSDKKKKRK